MFQFVAVRQGISLREERQFIKFVKENECILDSLYEKYIKIVNKNITKDDFYSFAFYKSN